MIRCVPLLLLTFSFCNPLPASTIVVPHIVHGVDPLQSLYYRTEFHIFNLSDSAVAGRVKLSVPAFSGTISGSWRDLTLGPRGMVNLRTDHLTQFLSGWATIESSAPVQVVIRLVAERVTTGEIVASTSLIPQEQSTEATAYALISEQANSGLALFNPSTTDSADLRLRLVSDSGTVIEEKNLTLGPQEKIAQFLSEPRMFPGFSAGRFEGSLQIVSSIPISTTVIRVDGNCWSTFPTFRLDKE